MGLRPLLHLRCVMLQHTLTTRFTMSFCHIFCVLVRLSLSPLFHHDRRLRIDSRRIFVPYADAGQAAGVVALASDLCIRMPQDCFLHNDVYLGHDDDQ